jgi:diacylglycerol kinase family enzyme
VAALAAGKTRRIDAGRATFLARDGREASTCFVNVASAGMSGLVTELVNLAPKHLGGTASFLIGTLRALRSYRFPPVRARVDDLEVHAGPLVLAAAANGRFFGGGMAVAPGAELDDGLLDIVLVPGFSRTTLLRQLPRIYRGTHLEVPGVSLHRGRGIALERMSEEQVWIELDGEPLGTLPARFEVIPGAITLFGLPE